MQVSCDKGGFITKLRPKEMVEPERFCARSDEAWKIMEIYNRGKSQS